MPDPARLREFVLAFTKFIETAGDDEERIFVDGKSLLADLIGHDDWLPDRFAESHPDHYRQNLLYCDPSERFSVVSFVWGPGQKTPVHDHTVWGMVGVMRGTERCTEYALDADSGELAMTGSHEISAGGIDLVSPRVGDIHTVENALDDRASISIHVYGGNIGAIERHVYDYPSGRTDEFVSGYSNEVLPNLWNRSRPVGI